MTTITPFRIQICDLTPLTHSEKYIYNIINNYK